MPVPPRWKIPLHHRSDSAESYPLRAWRESSRSAQQQYQRQTHSTGGHTDLPECTETLCRERSDYSGKTSRSRGGSEPLSAAGCSSSPLSIWLSTTTFGSGSSTPSRGKRLVPGTSLRGGQARREVRSLVASHDGHPVVAV